MSKELLANWLLMLGFYASLTVKGNKQTKNDVMLWIHDTDYRYHKLRACRLSAECLM